MPTEYSLIIHLLSHTSTILGKIMRTILFAFIFFLFSLLSPAQNTAKAEVQKNFRIGVETGLGYSYKMRSSNNLPGDYSRSGLGASFRIKWGTGNKFGAGFETGWIPISSLDNGSVINEFGSTSIKASLNALPVLIFVGMQAYNVQLHAGLGYYRVFASTTAFGYTNTSSEWDFGYMISLGYVYPLNSSFKFGTEIKWYNLVEVQTSVLSLQAKVLISLFEW